MDREERRVATKDQKVRLRSRRGKEEKRKRGKEKNQQNSERKPANASNDIIRILSLTFSKAFYELWNKENAKDKMLLKFFNIYTPTNQADRSKI